MRARFRWRPARHLLHGVPIVYHQTGGRTAIATFNLQTAAFEAGAEELQARAAVNAVDLDPGQRLRRTASRALHLQTAAEANEIGGVPHMLVDMTER